MDKDKAERLKVFKNCGMAGSTYEGAFGKIIISWNQKLISGQPLLIDNNIVVVKIHHIQKNFTWVVSNIYAPNNKNQRKKFWDNLATSRTAFKEFSWLFMGDFNTLLRDKEKFGVIHNHLDGRVDLMDFINQEALMDVDL